MGRRSRHEARPCPLGRPVREGPGPQPPRAPHATSCHSGWFASRLALRAPQTGGDGAAGGARSGRPARGSRRRLLSPHQLLTQSVGFKQKETSDEPASPGHGPCPPKHRGAEGAERGRRRYLDDSVAARQLVTATPPPRSDRPLPTPEGALPRLTGPAGKRGREPPRTPVSPSENSGGHGAQRARFCETAGSL